MVPLADNEQFMSVGNSGICPTTPDRPHRLSNANRFIADIGHHKIPCIE